MDGETTTFVYVERPVAWPEAWDNARIHHEMVEALRGQENSPQVRALMQLASDGAVTYQQELADPENAEKPGRMARAAGGATALAEFVSMAQAYLRGEIADVAQHTGEA